MHVFNTLFPVMLLIALGGGLARIHFLGSSFIAELNKLTYWVALPALIFRAAASAGAPQMNTVWMSAAIAGATLGSMALLVALSFAMRTDPSQRRTLIECGFFGNLAYIGLPILAHSMGLLPLAERPEMLASAAVAMTIMTVVNNLLVVMVMQPGGAGVPRVARQLSSNPVVLAGALGIVYGSTGFDLPVAADRALQTLGGMAVPAALICIGGSLIGAPVRGRVSALAASTLVKIAMLPLVAWMLAQWMGLSPADTRVVLVFAACPTAAAAYTMASQMGGDEALAAGAIAVSTVAAFGSLALALAVT
jgi:predicted permease